MDNNENKIMSNDISKKDIIRSLRACCAGDCKDCAYWRGEENTVDVCDICENEECGDCNKNCGNFDSCYDELMQDAAKALSDTGDFVDKNKECDSFEKFLKEHPFAPVEETDSRKDRAYKPAPRDMMEDRMCYIATNVMRKMEHGEFIEQKYIDEFVAIVRYYNQFCCQESSNPYSF